MFLLVITQPAGHHYSVGQIGFLAVNSLLFPLDFYILIIYILLYKKPYQILALSNHPKVRDCLGWPNFTGLKPLRSVMTNL